jgi:tight adherence protein B
VIEVSDQTALLRALALARRRRARSRLGIVSLAVAVALLFGVAPALAQSASGAPANGDAIVAVDMRAERTAVVVRAAKAPSNPAVVVNGVGAKVTEVKSAGQADLNIDTVLVIDTSSTSVTRLERIKTAAQRYVAGMQPGERMAVVSSGGVAGVEVAFTSDPARLSEGIAQLVAGGSSVSYEGVITAARLLGEQGVPLRNIVLVAASADAGAKRSGSVARAEAIDNDASVSVAALTSDDFLAGQVGAYQQLANETGGRFSTTGDPDQFSAVTTSLAEGLRGLYRIAIETTQASAGGNVIVDLGSGSMVAGFVPSTLTVGDGLRNTVVATKSSVSFLQGGKGLAAALLLGALAAGLAAFAIGSLVVKDAGALDSVLQPYAGVEDGQDGSALSKNAIFQRAVELTGSIAEKQGMLVKAERMLEQANTPLRAAEALTFYSGIVAGSMMLGLLWQRSILGLLIVGALGALVPPVVLGQKAKRRKKKFMLQLPDALALLAGTLKAGYSFMQGVEAVSHEVEEPMGSELRRVVTEAQLGRPLDEALDASAERMESPDFAWAVMAVRIQREAGGNLSELLMTVAETMTARQRLRGEVAALTAEGRISAIVLGILPVGLGAILFALNPVYMNGLLTDTIGRVLLGVACVSALIGFAWMKKIISIDI